MRDLSCMLLYCRLKTLFLLLWRMFVCSINNVYILYIHRCTERTKSSSLVLLERREITGRYISFARSYFKETLNLCTYAVQWLGMDLMNVSIYFCHDKSSLMREQKWYLWISAIKSDFDFLADCDYVICEGAASCVKSELPPISIC